MNVPIVIRKDRNVTASALFGVAALQLFWGAINWFVYSAQLNWFLTFLCMGGFIYFALGIAALWVRLPAALLGLILYAGILAYESYISVGQAADLVMTDPFLKIPIIILLLVAIVSPLGCSMSYKRGIMTLAAALVVSLGFLSHALWLSSAWRAQVALDAVCEGSQEAREDARQKRFRLFEFQGENKEDKFSGRHQGQYEIWYAEYHPSVDFLRFSEEKRVRTYNDLMKIWSSSSSNATSALKR